MPEPLIAGATKWDDRFRKGRGGRRMSRSWVASRTAAVLAAVVLLAGCAPKEGSPPPAATAPTHPDWRNATYTITCDGVVPDGFRATLTDGAARVPADMGSDYDYVDVRFEREAGGDVDGDRRPDTVVLLQCSPQPSNGILEEVHVFAAGGDELGVLPSPRSLRDETTVLPPVYDPDGLSVDDGDVVARMHAYGPDDTHASGPSVPLTVRWRWDGENFVRLP
jgi:hypothetical protein